MHFCDRWTPLSVSSPFPGFLILLLLLLLLQIVLSNYKIDRVTFPKQKWTHQRPSAGEAPVFTEHIRWVALTSNVVVGNGLGSDGFSYSMEAETHMTLV